MKEWIIKNEHSSFSILIDQVTILKGNIKDWEDEIKLLKDSFSAGNTLIQENNQRVVSQDYNLSVLSYTPLYESNSYNVSKGKLDDLFFSFLELSPIYKQFVEIWEELQEEVLFLNEEINIPMEFELKNYSKEVVKKKLVTISQFASSLDVIKNEIKLINFSNRSKLNLFLIINPENYLTQFEFVKLLTFLYSLPSQFIIVTNQMTEKVVNIKYHNQIINDLVLDAQKSKMLNLLPFLFTESLYEDARNLYKNIVDNSKGKTVFLSYSDVDNLEVFIYIFLLLYLTDIPFRLETKGISDQYQSYIESIIRSKV
ncbi:hypothetical protein GCM10008932_02860 [Alkalibacterium iburiense]|uniref:Uncharacterized protein n=1 Tax=Alkalibacterium iburiense TaxID=290589 RepID=A0ABN0X2A7_9LACT